MLKRYFLLLLPIAIFIGCGPAQKTISPTAPYAPIPGALDENYFHSPSGDLAAHYPKDWLHVDIQTIPMANVEEVYTDHERRWALVLSEIPGTAEFRRSVERDGMTALADQSFSDRSAKAPGKLAITRPAEVYTENGKLFASYEYTEVTPDSLHRKENRIVLFTTGAKFYELGMLELDVPRSPDEPAQNFRILESVTASLEGVAEVRADTTSF